MASVQDSALDTQMKDNTPSTSDTTKQSVKHLSKPDTKLKHREEKLADQQRQQKQALEEIRRIRQLILEEETEHEIGDLTDTSEDMSMELQENRNAEDDTGFHPVRGKKINRRKTSQVSANIALPQVKVTNRYEILTDNQQQEVAATTPASESQAPKAPKVPPIVIYNCSNHVKLCQELKDLISGSLKAAYTGDGVKFYVDTTEDYKIVFNYCQEKEIPFHTYQNANDRDLKVVVKDLPPTVTEKEVQKDLQSQGFTINDVHQFKRKENGKLRPLPVYAVTLPKGEKSDTIYGVRYVLSTKVRVEDYRSRKEPSQCKRCQRWTHTTNYCWLPARCVKCGGMHASTDCTQPEGTPPKRANCQGQHTASWKGCSEFQKALKKFRPLVTSTEKPQRGTTSAASNVKLVIADTTRSGTHLPQPPLPRTQPTTSTTKEDRTFASTLQGERIYTRPSRIQKDKQADAALNEVTTVLKFLNSQNFLSKLITAGKKMLAVKDKLSKIVILVETLAELEGSD